MKPNFFLAALFTTFWPVLISAQDWQYAKRYSAATGSILTNAAVSTAPDGSTYLVGTVRGTVMFDNISVSTPTGITQSYLLKLDMGAQAVWVQTFDQKAYDVTTDAQGNVFVAGAIAVGSPASDSLTFIAKYDANGQLLASLESSGAGKSWAKAVRTDAAGNCYATGWKTGTVSFGAFTLPDQGNRDNFLVKLSPDLALVNWAVNTGSSNKLDEVYDLELDDNGGIYTAGNYSQTFQLIPCFCYNGSFFTEKRSTSNGALFWQKIYSGGSGTSTQQVLALAGDGQTLYTASSFKNTVQIPPNITLTAQSGTDDYQLFAAGLNSTDGNVQWAKKISFTGDSYITGMAWAEDTLHLHGYFKSNTLMGNVLLEPLGTFDAFYTEVAPANGNVTNAEKFTGNGTDQGLGIVSGDGRLAVSGNTSSNSLTIGNFNLPGSTNSIYVAGKIFDIPLNISISNITDASCPGIADGSATVAVQGGVSPYTYLWNNGQTDATATGLAAGSYTVTVTDGAGTQISATATITEPPALTAGFANSVNGLSVSFSNNSSNAASYLWNFGDGQTSTEANPAHTYANCGMYTVTLTATNLCGNNTSMATVTIGNGYPEASFVSTVDSLSASFSNNSSNATSYTWNFGDGQTSSEANPEHTYTAVGSYTVTLIAGNMCGTDTFSQTVIIPPFGEAPIADFTADKLTVCAGDTIHFTNLSVNANTLSWWFPGGEPMNSTEANPAVVFNDAGLHSVVLTVYNDFGEDQEIKTEYIIVIGLPVANFGLDTSGLTVTFSDSSLHADNYFWEFGDGTSSTEPAPSHTYANPGAYTIRLTVQNTCGADVLEKTIELGIVSSSIPGWLDALRLYPNPNNGVFNLELNGPVADAAEFDLFGVDGRLIRHETAGFSSGFLNHRFECSEAPAGSYLLRIRIREKVTFAKVLIQR